MALGPGGAGWTRGSIVASRYRLEDEIGRGGFGAVHRATRLSDGLQVALKLLTYGAMMQADTAARFRREAELAMRLTHPSTIRVLDTGYTQHGTPFIAFELLQGRSLEAVLAGGPLNPTRALEVAEALLGSLDEAHRLGIVHRDIKPANIFLCVKPGAPALAAGDPGGGVKLLDFGVAKEVISNEMGVTAEGIMIGTPAYMSPEQIGSKPVAASTDLYAVGLVLAEMLTGKVVYDGAPLVVCMDKVRGVAAPLGAELRATPFFDAIERATRLSPAERPPSAAAMLAELNALARRAVLGLAATALPPLPASRPTPEPTSRKPPSKGGGTAIMMAPIVVDPRPPSAQQDPRAPHAQQVVVSAGASTSYPDVYADTHGVSTPQGVAALRAQLGRGSAPSIPAPPQPYPGPLTAPPHPPLGPALPAPLPPPPRPRRSVAVWVAALLLLVAVAGGVALWLFVLR